MKNHMDEKAYIFKCIVQDATDGRVIGHQNIVRFYHDIHINILHHKYDSCCYLERDWFIKEKEKYKNGALEGLWEFRLAFNNRTVISPIIRVIQDWDVFYLV
jgi:hypothetical protein